MNCPFISPRVRDATVRFLRGPAWNAVKASPASAFVAQSLASATRQAQFLYVETMQALFVGSLGGGHCYTRPLLGIGRGYEVGNERELSQVARKMGVGGGRDVLHAAVLFCLSLGPGTCSRLNELGVSN